MLLSAEYFTLDQEEISNKKLLFLLFLNFMTNK